MKVLVIFFFITFIGLLGFIIFKDTEMRKQVELNQLMNEENRFYPNTDYDESIQPELAHRLGLRF